MIDFDKIPDFMQQLNCSYVRITDMNNQLLYQIDNDENVATAATKFKDLKGTLQGYAKILVNLCDKGKAKQGWKNGYTYTVFFASAAPVHQQQQGVVGAGGIPGFGLLEIMNLNTENAILKMKLELGGKKNKHELPEIPESYFNIAEMLGMGNRPAGKGSLAGEQKLTLDDVDLPAELQKKVTRLQELMGSLVEKVDIEKLIKVCEAANNDPRLIDKVLMFVH